MKSEVQGMTEKVDVIVCPICGRQYVPAEIYYPNSFLGKPAQIDRNEKGEIEFFNGKSMDLTETYVCDKCSTRFKVTASINFTVEKISDNTFSEVYVAELFKDKIELDENF